MANKNLTCLNLMNNSFSKLFISLLVSFQMLSIIAYGILQKDYLATWLPNLWYFSEFVPKALRLNVQ